MAAPAVQKADGLKALTGDKFLKRNGDVTSYDDSVKGNDLVGFYFSAHWCGPCRAFTPKLV